MADTSKPHLASLTLLQSVSYAVAFGIAAIFLVGCSAEKVGEGIGGVVFGIVILCFMVGRFLATNLRHQTRAFIDAMDNNDAEKVRAWIKSDPDIVNAKADDGWMPLHWAVERDSKEFVELLLANGAKIDAKAKYGWTPLHFAARASRKEIGELLLANGADANAKDKDSGSTLTHWAVQWGSAEIVELLLANGATINTKNNCGETPLDMVANSRASNIEMAELLRAHGAKTGAELDVAKP